MSYRDNLYFGMIACRELVPDVDKLTGYLEDELGELTGGLDRPPPPSRRKPRRAVAGS